MADMRILFGLLAFFLIAGCLWSPLGEGNETAKPTTVPQGNQSTVVNATTNVSEPAETATGEEKPRVSGGEGTILEVPDKPTTSTATSQADCSTLSADCESCLAKSGCSWCKGTNACYYKGIVPTISSCEPGEWANTVSECKLVSENESCSKFTNCADCLSGTGCRWCIQGSVCASEDSSESCFGGWMDKSYQCNYASR